MDNSKNTHAYLAPSSASRWVNCTASPSKVDSLRTEKIIVEAHKEVSSSAATEGTAMHDLAERYLKWNLLEKAEWDIEEDTIPDELWQYIDHCLNLAEIHKPCDIGIEDKVPLFYKPDETGTVDFCVVTEDHKKMFVRDLKWGMMIVDSERNSQLAIYAYSECIKREMPSDAIVDIAVVQPRIADNEIKPWILSVAELAEYCNHISIAAERIYSKTQLEFRASKTICQWCPAKSHCAARIGPVMETVTAIPEDAVEANDITMDQRLYLWENRDRIMNLMKDIMSSFFDDATQGNPPPGTKLVKGRLGNRRWAGNVMEAALYLEELGIDPYEKKLISPVEAERRGATAEAVANLTFRPDGKPVLAEESDKRPEYNPNEGETSF